jgi:hypothetical protein
MFTDSDSPLRGYAMALHVAGGLAALAVAFGGWHVVERPIARREQELNTRIEQACALGRRAHDLSQQHRRLQEMVASWSERIEIMETRLNAAAHPSQFFEQLTQLLHGTAVSVHDYRPGAVQDSGPVRQHAVQLSASGDYAALCRFLVQLEDLPLLCKISQFRITAGQANSLSMEFGLLWSAELKPASNL